ncbi:MAG TPA: hypothetical protein VF720_05230 [Candidatus Eisenbacteria bacterium]
MNTETRRHDEKSAYHRRAKYRDDPIDDEELGWMNEEDGGVLDDWKDVEESADSVETPPMPPTATPSRPRAARRRTGKPSSASGPAGTAKPRRSGGRP